MGSIRESTAGCNSQRRNSQLSSPVPVTASRSSTITLRAAISLGRILFFSTSRIWTGDCEWVVRASRKAPVFSSFCTRVSLAYCQRAASVSPLINRSAKVKCLAKQPPLCEFVRPVHPHPSTGGNLSATSTLVVL